MPLSLIQEILVDSMKFIKLKSQHLALSVNTSVNNFHIVDPNKVEIALSEIVVKEDWNTVFFLLNFRCDPVIKSQIIFSRTCLLSCNSFVDKLIENNPELIKEDVFLDIMDRVLRDSDEIDVSVNDNSAIIWACEKSYLKIIRRLMLDPDTGEINRKIDFSARDNVIIKYACAHGNIDVLDVALQDDRVDPSVDNNKPLEYASRFSHLNVVERLLKDDRVRATKQCIILSVDSGHIEILEILLANHKTRDSTESLDACFAVACERGHARVVKVLIKHGRVDPSFAGNHAIRRAVKHGHLKVIEILLEDDRVDPVCDQNYPLRMSKALGHQEIVERLMKDKRVYEYSVSH